MGERSSKRKWLIGGAVAVIVLAAVLIVALLNLNSLIARNKDYLLQQAEQTMGRKLKVGAIEATIFSGLGVKLMNFSMADDPRYSKEDFIRARDLQVIVNFWPLLKKEVRVKKVILHDPTIVVIRDSSGNFNFSSIGKKETAAKDEAREKTERPDRREAPGAVEIALVDISGGDVRYIDRKNGTDLRVRRVDLRVEDFEMNQPFSVRLAAALFADKQNLEFAGKFGALRAGMDFMRLALDGKLDIDPLDLNRLKAAAPKLKDALPKELDLAGVFRVKALKFKGTLKDLALEGEIEGTQGALRYGSSFHKPTGVAFVLGADARYSGDRISIRKGRLKLHSVELATTGDIQLGDAPALNLSVDSKPANLDGWDKIIPAISSYELAGTMEVRAKLRGRLGKGATPEVQGVLNLTKASAKPPGFPKPIENLDTRINFTGQRADIGDMTLTLGSSRIRVAAAIERFTPLTVAYKLSTPELRPADYNATLSEERKADVLRNLVSEGQLSMAGGSATYQGKLTSADGTLYKVAYKGLETQLTLANQIAHIKSLRVSALSGSIQLDGDYAFKEPAPRFTIATKVQGIDVKELYSALDAKAERDMRGRLNAEMRLAGNGKTWEEVKPTLQGQGEAEVLQGALLNLNIAEAALNGITGVPGLTNLINPSVRRKYPETFNAKDTEFKELKMTVDVSNSRMNVKSLRMSAADFFVQGNGWADFSRRVDFRGTLNFSDRLSGDIAQSAREVRYVLNNQGQLEIPFALTGRLPDVKVVPDSRYLGQIVQRGFLRKGAEELQNRFLGGRQQQAPQQAQENPPAESGQKRKSSTEDLIRRGLEGLFRR